MPSWKKIIVSGSNAELNQLTATSYGGNISGSATSTGSFAKLRLSDSIELNTSASTDAIIHSGGENQGGTGNNLLLYTGEKKQHYTSLIDIEPGYSGNIILNPHNDKLKVHGRLEFHESYAITTAGTNDLNITTREGSTPWAGYGDSSQIIVESDTNAGIKLYTHGTGTVYISGSSAGDKLEVVGGIKATGNISGSSTSTGSFGVLKLDKFNGGIGANTNTLYGVDAGSSIDASVTTETAIGYQALKDNANAGANTAVGSYALWQYNGSTGRNTAVGLKAGWNLTGGYRGTYIGWEAEAGGANNIGEIVIGYAVTGKGSNTAVIGGGNITDIYMSSDVGAKLHTGDVSGSAISTGSFGELIVDSNGTFGGDLAVGGNITAQNFIVSSSVTSIEYQSLSGSTIFGDSNDDTHEFTGSVSFSGSIVQPHMDGNATALSLLGGNFTVSNSQFVHQANGGSVRFGTSNSSFNHGGGKVYTRQDGGYGGGSNVAFLATDHPVGAGFWVDPAGNMKFGHDDGAGARTVVDMMTLGPQTGHASGSLLVSGSIIAKEGNISGSAQSTGSFGKLLGDGSSLTGISATSDVVDDTSPQLGGNLDLNSNDITGTGNINITGNISGSATSTGSFGRVENASGKFRVLGTTAEISSPGLTQLHIFQDGLGTNSNAPSLKIGNNGQGNGYEFTLSVGTSGQANFSGNVSSAGSLRGTQFDGVNSRGTAGTALFAATGNGGDGGGMYFGGGGAFDIRFSTTEKERLRIEKESNGGGIQTSGSVNIGGIGATDAGLTVAGAVTIGGNLTVNGDTTTISTSNILVQDAFGFFATGSAGTNVDAGIIVQSGSFVDSGSALYHDISSERWSVGKGIASTATNVPDSKWGGFVATVYTASASPVGSSPKYGVGEIHVDDDGEIYIYS